MLLELAFVIISLYVCYYFLKQKFIRSEEDYVGECQQLIECHLQRSPEWLEKPFDIGLPKPNGNWVFTPSVPTNDSTVDTGRQIWQFIPSNQLSNPSADQSSPSNSFTFNSNENPNSSDKVYRSQLISQNINCNLDLSSSPPNTISNALLRGVDYFIKLQNKQNGGGGFWGGDYGGPNFLLPGLIIAAFITNTLDTSNPSQSKDCNPKSCTSPSNPSNPIISYAHRYSMIKYILNHQQKDGGWGLHIESHSTMFGTVMQYISLRLLGLSSKHPACELALKFIHKSSVFTVPSWCKFYLCILGIFDYKIVEYPIPTELWLLPKWFFFHPGNLWCHARMVYLPMSYLYSKKWQCNPTKYPIIKELRNELLHPLTYESIDNWDKLGHFNVSSLDQIVPSPHGIVGLLYKVLYWYEWSVLNGTIGKTLLLPILPILKYLRQLGNDFALDYMNNADKQTNYINIGPVNKVLHLVSIFVNDKDDPERSNKVSKHQERLLDYLWVSEDGMKMQGYNGSQLWDTAFGTQAILESKNCIEPKIGKDKILDETLAQSLNYFEKTQIVFEANDNWTNNFFRSKQLGAWPFSTRQHGWPISDCTAEALKCVYGLQSNKEFLQSLEVINKDETEGNKIEILDLERLNNGIDTILYWQNNDGGWATYEQKRGFEFYEDFNPSQVFKNIMIDYSHIECTSACIQAILGFIEYCDNNGYELDDDRRDLLLEAVAGGVKFLKNKQFKDGKFIGFWAICCTYAMWFATIAFQLTHDSKMGTLKNIDNSKELDMIEEFLLSKQSKIDGGWNESYKSCVSQDCVEISKGCESQVVQTAWAMLSLLVMGSNKKDNIDKGKEYLLSKQLDNGDWPQQHIMGIFNHTCGISYTNYRNIFPIWALAKYTNVYGTK